MSFLGVKNPFAKGGEKFSWKSLLTTAKTGAIEDRRRRLKNQARGVKLPFAKFIRKKKADRINIVNGFKVKIKKALAKQTKAKGIVEKGKALQEKGKAKHAEIVALMEKKETEFEEVKEAHDLCMNNMHQELEDCHGMVLQGVNMVSEGETMLQDAMKDKEQAQGRMMVAEDINQTMDKTLAFCLASRPMDEIKEGFGWSTFADLDEVPLDSWSEFKNALVDCGLEANEFVVNNGVVLARTNMSNEDSKAIVAQALGIEVTPPEPEEVFKRLADEMEGSDDEEPPAKKSKTST